MKRQIRIPVQKSGKDSEDSPAARSAAVTDAVPDVTEPQAVTMSRPPATRQATREGDLEMWRDRALRLQAEMDNFRKRQRRLAEEQILTERERLLRAILPVVDDLQRALDVDQGGAESLREGVALTNRSLMQRLRQQGVEPIQAEGQTFDPRWHEAVGAVPQRNVEPDTVVQVIQPGYRLGDRLLRPARVIVAA